MRCCSCPWTSTRLKLLPHERRVSLLAFHSRRPRTKSFSFVDIYIWRSIWQGKILALHTQTGFHGQAFQDPLQNWVQFIVRLNKEHQHDLHDCKPASVAEALDLVKPLMNRLWDILGTRTAPGIRDKQNAATTQYNNVQECRSLSCHSPKNKQLTPASLLLSEAINLWRCFWWAACIRFREREEIIHDRRDKK